MSTNMAGLKGKCRKKVAQPTQPFSSFNVGVSAFVLGILAGWISLETIFRVVSLSFIIVAVLVYKDYLKEKRYKNI